MGNIFEAVKALGQPDKAIEEWLKTHEYGVAPKKVGDKGYTVHPDGKREEVSTLEVLEEHENWAKVTSSFYDNDGKKVKMTMTLFMDDPDPDGDTDSANDIKLFPSAVYTASGRLVYLIRAQFNK